MVSIRMHAVSFRNRTELENQGALRETNGRIDPMD